MFVLDKICYLRHASLYSFFLLPSTLFEEEAFILLTDVNVRKSMASIETDPISLEDYDLISGPLKSK
jgi:hypothetical protein